MFDRLKQMRKAITREEQLFNWFLWAVHDDVLDPNLTFFTD
jgi:hypothetical protein